MTKVIILCNDNAVKRCSKKIQQIRSTLRVGNLPAKISKLLDPSVDTLNAIRSSDWRRIDILYNGLEGWSQICEWEVGVLGGLLRVPVYNLF